MAKESISFSKEYNEEYKFFLKEAKGNKSWYICELLRKERLNKMNQEGSNNEYNRKNK